MVSLRGLTQHSKRNYTPPFPIELFIETLTIRKYRSLKSPHNIHNHRLHRSLKNFLLRTKRRKYIIKRITTFQLLLPLALDDGDGLFGRFGSYHREGPVSLFSFVHGAEANDYLYG